MQTRRKDLRLRGYDYSQEGMYFVNLCVKDREDLFGEINNDTMQLNQFGEIVDNIWKHLPNRFPRIALDSYIVMPNHIHGIIVINKPECEYVGEIHEFPLRITRRKMLLPMVIGYFKMNSANAINQLRSLPGIGVWQRNYYEHIIRDEMDLNRIREYIVNNPKNWAMDEENLNR